MMKRFTCIRTFTLAATVGLLGTLAVPQTAHACDKDLCITSGDGANWKAGASMSAKQVKKERKKNRKRKSSSVSFTIDGARGSVFVDGHYRGTAPVKELDLKPGKHDIQVRDGSDVLAEGVLTVPRKSTDIQITVSS